METLPMEEAFKVPAKKKVQKQFFKQKCNGMVWKECFFKNERFKSEHLTLYFN